MEKREYFGASEIRGNKITINLSTIAEINENTDITILQVGEVTSPVKGTLNTDCFVCGTTIPNTRISFMKYYPNSIYIPTPNNIIYEQCMSNKYGEYYAFLESGKYHIRVDVNGKYFYLDVNIDQGIEEYYEYIETASIKKKYSDVTEIYGTDKVYISGCIIDEYNKPVKNGQLIISQSDNIVAFIHLDNGKYGFLASYGTYDIRIRSPKHSVQIIKGFKFEEGKGFFPEAVKNTIFYSTDNWLNKVR